MSFENKLLEEMPIFLNLVKLGPTNFKFIEKLIDYLSPYYFCLKPSDLMNLYFIKIKLHFKSSLSKYLL